MTPAEFSAALTELGWTQRRFAALLNRHVNAVSKWATGETTIPDYVILTLNSALELQRLQASLSQIQTKLYADRR